MKKFLLAVLCVIFVLVCIGTCGSLMSSNSVNSSVDSDTVAVDTSTLMTEDQHPTTKKSWDLSTSQDDMDDSKSYWYSLQSDNYANLIFLMKVILI